MDSDTSANTGGHIKAKRGTSIALLTALAAFVGFGASANGAIAAPTMFQGPTTTRYSLTDIGDLGFGYTQAEGLNEQGQIAGESQLPDGSARAFIWSPESGLAPLAPIYSGDRNSTGWALNDLGDVCGTSGIHAAIWYGNGTTRDLGDLGYHGFTSYCFAINNLGHAVGQSWSADSRAPMFFWTPQTGMQDLGAEGEAYAINDSDQVTGQSLRTVFVWTSGSGIRDLGTLTGGAWSVGNSINSAGWIAGSSDVGGNHQHAFIWPGNGPLLDLGTLGGEDSLAGKVLTDGTVYGWSTTAVGDVHAFKFDSIHGMVDLNLQLPTGWQLERGRTTPAGNGRGEIAIYAIQPSTGFQHTFAGEPSGATTTTVRCHPIIVWVHHATRCTATIGGSAVWEPTGTVTFAVDGAAVPFASCTVVARKCSIRFRPVTPGIHILRAAYSGDTFHISSTGTSAVIALKLKL